MCVAYFLNILRYFKILLNFNNLIQFHCSQMHTFYDFSPFEFVETCFKASHMVHPGQRSCTVGKVGLQRRVESRG